MAFAKPLFQRSTLWLLLTGLVLVVVSGFFYLNLEHFSRGDRLIRHTHRVIVAITKSVSSLREAEAVQRGYLLSGEAAYLQPYASLLQSVAKNWAELKELTVDNPDQQQRIARLEPLIAEKIADLDLTIAVRRDQDFLAAQRLVMNNYGKDVMDIIRAEVDSMLADESRLMNERNAVAETAYRISIATIVTFLLAGLVLMLVTARQIRHSQRVRDQAGAAQRRHEAQLEERIMLRTAQVRQLAEHLESIREEEKRAIARELHDDIGSSMTALSMILEGHFRQNAAIPTVAKSADKIRGLLKEVTHSTRRIQAGLRPNTLDSLGLVEAVRELLGEFSQRTGIVSTLELPGNDSSIPMRLQVPLFRMLQEALNNVAKHAKAGHVEVAMEIDAGWVRMRIQDDGVGITSERAANAQTHGLLGMRERAAYLDGSTAIGSPTGRGTVVTVCLPLAVGTPTGDALADIGIDAIGKPASISIGHAR